MGDDEGDEPYPQAVVLSQTCWEYRNLLDQELTGSSGNGNSSSTDISPAPAAVETTEAAAAVPTTPAAAGTRVPLPGGSKSKGSKTSDSRGSSIGDGEPGPKRAKTGAAAAASPQRRAASTPTTPLETLRLAGKGENPGGGSSSSSRRRSSSSAGTWDIFVLVLQASGLQQITSKAWSEIDFGTLLVADHSASFFRLALWARAAREGSRLVRPGDLVRFNG